MRPSEIVPKFAGLPEEDRYVVVGVPASSRGVGTQQDHTFDLPAIGRVQRLTQNG